MAANGKFQDYCLKWNNYHQHLSSAFLQLLENESMVDVTLSAGDERIRAHKIVLSACSPYFQDIFATAEDKHPTVIFSDVNPEDLKSVLEFIYRGELCVMASRFASVLKIAHDLKIRGLSEVSFCLPGLEEVSGVENLVDHEPCDESIKSKSTISEQNIIPSDKSVSPCPVPEVDALEESETIKAVTEVIATKDDADPVSSISGQEMEICRGEEVGTETVVRDGGELAGDHNLLIIKGGREGSNEIENDNENGPKISVHGIKSSIRPFSRYVKRCEGLVQITAARKKNLKSRYRKEYSEESLSEALDELRRGRPLLETAAAHHIPRSTLYVRARGLGIQLPLTRQEYPGEMMSAAIQAVQSGTSLKRASDHFKIPKTVLWRKVRRELENGTIQYHRKADKIVRCPPYTAEERMAAIDALIRGESISRVFREYKVPKTTLFRERARLIASGRIPSSSQRREDGTRRGNALHEQLDLAVAACLKRGMTHALAAVTYQVPKTTLWRRLQQLRKKNGDECADDQDAAPGNTIIIQEATVEEGKDIEGEDSSIKLGKVYSNTKEVHGSLEMDPGTLEMVVENEVTVKEGEEGSVVSFVGADGTTSCTEALQLPPGSSLIILTTGEGIELQEGEQIIVETDETSKEILNGDE